MPDNIHGTTIILGELGILVTGASGSGKTTLALALLGQFGRNRFSRIVGDDQLFIEGHAGRLICRAPQTIAGLAEVPGLGPRPLVHEPATLIDHVFRLVPPEEMSRFQDDAWLTIAGCRIPVVALRQRNVTAALPIIASRLAQAPFA